MDTKWFQHQETKVTPYRLQGQYSNIYVGETPTDGMTQEYADQFDAFINVSDTVCESFAPSRPGQAMHFYPVNECGRWGYAYLYWLKKVMDYHFDAGHKIYLHCHAGAYRSPSAAVLWIMSRGTSLEFALVHGTLVGDKSHLHSLWRYSDNIPRHAVEFFGVMRAHPSVSLAGILNQLYKLEPWNNEFFSGHHLKYSLLYHYFWWYYGPKYWLRAKRDRMMYFFRKHGYRVDGCATHIYRRKYFWAWPKNAEKYDEIRGGS